MIVYRTILFYCALILVIRLMGKRQVGQMEPSEFVVTMLLANLASIPVEDLERPVWHGLTAMALVLIAERLVSWACLKNIRLRKILCGKPVILIDNGTLLYGNLRKTRVTLDELTGHLRELGILEIQQVQFAILETNGALTAFPYPHYKPAEARDAGITASDQELPYTIISDGKLLPDNLHLCGKDEAWLTRYLISQRVCQADIVLLTLTKSGKTALICR